MLELSYIRKNLFFKTKKRMPSLSYQIFNKHIKLNEKIIMQFIKEVEKLFTKFKEDKDIDNLKVLKNKLSTILDESPKKLSKVAKKELKVLEALVEEFDSFIEHIKKQDEKNKLIDIVEEVNKNYKTCDMIPNNKRDKYAKFCIKKKKVKYEQELIVLQAELLKLQKHIKENGEKLLIIFE